MRSSDLERATIASAHILYAGFDPPGLAKLYCGTLFEHVLKVRRTLRFYVDVGQSRRPWDRMTLGSFFTRISRDRTMPKFRGIFRRGHVRPLA